MVLKLQLASELPGIFLRHRWMAGPCPGVSDPRLKPDHLHLQQVLRWRWSCWSRTHTLRTAGLEKIRWSFQPCMSLLSVNNLPCEKFLAVMMPWVEHSWRKISVEGREPPGWPPPSLPRIAHPQYSLCYSPALGCRSSFVSRPRLVLCTLQPGLCSGSCASLWWA